MEIAWSYDNLSVRNIRNSLRKKDLPTNRWVLLYLYRYSMDDRAEVTQELFREYGAEICNWLGSGIPLYTVFPKETFESWKDRLDYGVAEAMEKNFEYSEHSIGGDTKYTILQQLGKDYDVREKEYPALVVIDAKNAGFTSEMYSVLHFAYNSAAEIFEAMKRVIETIRTDGNDPQKVFSVCDNQIRVGLTPVSRKLEEAKRISLANVLNVLLRAHSTTVTDLSYSLQTCSRSGYYNYISRDKMPFETALEIALELQADPEEFVHLLDFTDATYPQKTKWREGKDRRFETIKYCMRHRMKFDQTNEYLKEHRFKPIGTK